MIFVDEKYFPRFGIRDNAPEKIYRPKSPEIMKLRRSQWGRNGNGWPKDKDKLYWEKLVIEKKFILDR